MVGHPCCHGAIEDFRVIEETTGTVRPHDHLWGGVNRKSRPVRARNRKSHPVVEAKEVLRL